MLQELTIRGLAIIDHLTVNFGPGLTTITGETGAGKSLLLGALRLLVGQRASSEWVTSGKSKALVQAVFDPLRDDIKEFLRLYGLEADPDEPPLLLRRELLASGGSRHYVNDIAVTLSRLEELGRLLVAIHGQNDQALLLQPSAQLTLLDLYGRCGDELARYEAAYTQAKEAASRLEHFLEASRDLEQRREFLRFQVAEIDQATIKPGEERELQAELLRLRHAQKLFEAAQAVVDRLYEGERNPLTATHLVAECEKLLDDVCRYDGKLSPLVSQLQEIRVSIVALAAELRTYLQGLEAHPCRLEELEERMDVLRTLLRKYGPTSEDVLKTRVRLAQELDELENYELHLEQARLHLMQALEELEDAASALRKKREKAARQLQALVEKEMQGLSLPGAQFRILLLPREREIETATTLEKPGEDAGDVTVQTATASNVAPFLPERFGPRGTETVEFMALLNVGDEFRPLRKIASGGELSRIMLAIEAVLAERDKTSILIFDEIDAGISGEAAERVGEKLRRLAENHQVICVTHLPQIAASGHQQLVVEKSVQANRTEVSVRAVEGEQREAALARMLAGKDVDTSTRRFARRLLERFH